MGSLGPGPEPPPPPPLLPAGPPGGGIDGGVGGAARATPSPPSKADPQQQRERERERQATDLRKSANSAFQTVERAAAAAAAAPAPSPSPAAAEAVAAWGNRALAAADPEVWDLIEQEKSRQWAGIELIASENFSSQAVLEALGSPLTNKYSEGMVGARYYGGNAVIDKVEALCHARALAAFRLSSDRWGVNVQPYSCTSANFAVYTALLAPGDRIMGLDLPSGGHLSHGYYTPSGKRISSASIFFESLPYKVSSQTGYIDFERLEEKALEFRPRLLICGGSAYPREWDYARFRQIADRCGALLMCDMAHISGLVAAQECRSPFEFCDVVTSTTHKSLRGPRAGMIFFRRGPRPPRRPHHHLLLLASPPAAASSVSPSVEEHQPHYDYEERINFAIFPSLQGGPHNHHIAALAVALKEAASAPYRSYMAQVRRNATALANALMRRGCRLVTNGTDNHLMLWDLRPLGLTGNRYEKVCELCHITLNKNAVFGDSTALAPGGVRLGTAAMTSRGCNEVDMERIGEYLVRAAQITQRILQEHPKLQREFVRRLEACPDLLELRAQVTAFARLLPMPGFEATTMKYRD
eukprot:SM000270S10361  [mRNA]  locus=s270:88878:91255:+ [translate_table: standard]